MIKRLGTRRKSREWDLPWQEGCKAGSASGVLGGTLLLHSAQMRGVLPAGGVLGAALAQGRAWRGAKQVARGWDGASG